MSVSGLPPIFNLEEAKNTAGGLERRLTRLIAKAKKQKKSRAVKRFSMQLLKGQRYLRRGLKAGVFSLERFHLYRQTYQLLDDRLNLLLSHLKQRSLLPAPCKPPSNQDAEVWLDYVDDLASLVEQYTDEMWHQAAADRLQIIELVDVLERLRITRDRHPKEIIQERRIQNALRLLEHITRSYLYRSGVRRIEIEIGAYPPVQTTRVLFDGELAFTDEIIVNSVVEPGYRWDRHVLRRAAVTVQRIQ
jgi:hypothetical protein